MHTAGSSHKAGVATKMKEINRFQAGTPGSTASSGQTRGIIEDPALFHVVRTCYGWVISGTWPERILGEKVWYVLRSLLTIGRSVHDYI